MSHHGTSPLAIAAALAVAATVSRSTPARAHPEIDPGDVAIVAIHTGGLGGPPAFAFVTLASFHPVETVRFTDRGWLAAGRFRSGEGELAWDVLRPVPSGSVISIVPGAGEPMLEARADQIFAFVGPLAADGTPSDALLFGLQLGGPWQADATSTSTSALPPALAGYAVALGPSLSCAYAGPTSGTKAELLALIVDPTRWTCSDTARAAPPSAFTVYLARGDLCTSDGECAPGTYCAHGVCCDSECRRDEAFHCATCMHGPPGDPRNGTCGPAPPTFLCRLGRGPCDPMDHCDGVSTDCPPNVLSGPETVCRGSAGGCDPPEVCTGTAAECPVDETSPSGTTCRPARSGCDVEERCTGEGPACPDDVLVPDGTSCDDGRACTLVESCLAGLCTGEIPRACDDDDPCTADACDDAGGCAHERIAGCCARNADCDDGDPCTLDACGGEGYCLPPVARCRDAGTTGPDAEPGPGPGAPGCACALAPSGARDALPAASALALVLARIVSGRARRRRTRRAG